MKRGMEHVTTEPASTIHLDKHCCREQVLPSVFVWTEHVIDVFLILSMWLDNINLSSNHARCGMIYAQEILWFHLMNIQIQCNNNGSVYIPKYHPDLIVENILIYSKVLHPEFSWQTFSIFLPFLDNLCILK